MKVKTIRKPIEEALAIPPPKRKKLKKPSFLFQTLVRILSVPDLIATKFSYTKSRMKEAGKGPYLILMNHSSFIDLKIASKVFYPMPYFIVSTADALIGKEWLMRKIGCVPTRKFVADVGLVRDMVRAVKEKKTSVLLFPEAGYTFDGCTTTLPRKMGVILKRMDVPVLTLITDGAFLRQPLYNNLRIRKTKVTAHLQCLLTREEIQEKSVEELDELIDGAFSFDNFRAQAEKKTVIDSPYRAEGLERILYRCPACQTEGKTVGEGTFLTCKHCGKRYEMDVYGRLTAVDGETEFAHIPDWYRWERACVKEELLSGNYRLDLDVDIYLLIDYKSFYPVGEGRLSHDSSGFRLEGCDGKLHYEQSPLSSYGLNADFYFYEIDDVICIGDTARQYYCFTRKKNVAAKTRLAAEELYKICRQKKSEPNAD